MEPFFINEILTRPKNNLDKSCFGFWFKKIDTDNNELVSIQELQAYFATIGFKPATGSPPPPPPPTEFIVCQGKKYVRDKELGQGSFGVVVLYKAADGSDKKIAVKIAKG